VSAEQTTTQELLRATDQLLEAGVPGVSGIWPRACAFLMRMALELSIADFWASNAPGVESSSMRAQLLCLREYSDRQLAALADSVWAALSNACHYHSYDVEPTAAELRAWHDQVTDVCGALASRVLPGEGSEKRAPTDVSESETLALRRYRYSAEQGGWIDSQMTAIGRRSRTHSEEEARGLERVHQEGRLQVLARMGKAESEDERDSLRQEWIRRRAIVRAAVAGDPLPR